MNKKLPFPTKFLQQSVTDPLQVPEAFDYLETRDDVHTVIVDSQTFLMDMYESLHVLGAADGMKGWSNYAQFFKNLMQLQVAKSTKNVFFTAHVQSVLNKQEHVMETKIPVKGALSRNGIEAFYSTIVTARTITLDALEKYDNPLLTITEDDEIVGYKHVFQTRLTKDTVGERGMRAPMGMWSIKETYIDNDCQLLLNRLNEFYN